MTRNEIGDDVFGCSVSQAPSSSLLSKSSWRTESAYQGSEGLRAVAQRLGHLSGGRRHLFPISHGVRGITLRDCPQDDLGLTRASGWTHGAGLPLPCVIMRGRFAVWSWLCL